MTAADVARTRADTWVDPFDALQEPLRRLPLRAESWGELERVSAAGERHLALCDEGCWRCGR